MRAFVQVSPVAPPSRLSEALSPLKVWTLKALLTYVRHERRVLHPFTLCARMHTQ